MSQKRNIFLSHSHKDKHFVRQLAVYLEKADLSCWVDEAELDFGDSIIDRIGQGIYESDLIAAVISKNSVRSAWVQKELQLAMTREISGQKIRVLPIIIDSCTELIPYYLRDKLYADFRDIDKFENNIDLLVHSVQKRLELPISGGTKVGSIDIGKVIHDRGDDFHGFREVRTMAKTAIFNSCAGLAVFIMAMLIQRSGWVFTSKGLGIAGGIIMLSGLIKLVSSYYLQVSFDRDRRLLYEWEKFGDTGFDFSKKWQKRYRAGASVPEHRTGMALQGIATLLLVAGMSLLMFVFIFEIINGT